MAVVLIMITLHSKFLLIDLDPCSTQLPLFPLSILYLAECYSDMRLSTRAIRNAISLSVRECMQI